ncbi:MAG: PAS domain S-box protein [Sphingomonadaceae bacterium]|nr:PAS domain S-box protein [Sphingomonadaceae bacterium]
MSRGGKAIEGRLLDDPRVAAMLARVSDFTLSETDAEGICTRFEPYSDLYTLAPPTEIIGQRLDYYYPPQERANGMYERFLAAARANGRVEGEGWRYRIDGTRRWMRFSIEARRDEAGEITGFVGVSYDVTHERDSARKLYASEEAMRFLVNGLTGHAIYMLDPDGAVTNWNAGAERLKGYIAEEIVGQHFSCFYTEEDRAAGLPARALAIARDEGRFEGEGWRIRKDGSRFRAHVLIQPLVDYEDKFVGFAKMTRDITAEHRAAEDLADAREKLAQTQRLRSLGELTGGIAHDFNNLLTVIRGSAELLSRPGFDEAKRGRQLRAIIETADRAAELTGQLLAFARRQPLQPRALDLNEQIAGMAELLGRTLGKPIAIRTRLTPDLWSITADPAQLHSVILNAAINARDAIAGQGSVTFITENVAAPEGDCVRLAIVDDGEGMSPEVRARVFEPFFTTKPVGKGTGLGLSQAYGFAAQSGGRIEIDSAPGEGTTLSLYLLHVLVFRLVSALFWE